MIKRFLIPSLAALAILGASQAAWAGNGTEIYDTRGQLITVVRGKQRRIHQPLSAIPEVTRDAVIAIEDSRFYEHGGIDIRGLGRALWTDLRAGGKVQGGSTITQQLV
ncbi:MAG TPA: biosynthetic peptidoglycan transglycosylase, partial [Stenomitos sp.]